jgi:hypothetical protein
VSSLIVPLWLSGLDTHLSREHPGFDPSSRLDFFVLFLSVTYVIFVFKKMRETEGFNKKEGEQNINRSREEERVRMRERVCVCVWV